MILLSRLHGVARCLATFVLISCLGVTTLQAQSGLSDNQVAVVTSDGLFLVGPGQVTVALLTAADFGRTTLCEPSVTWLEGSPDFVVTSLETCGEAAGLFRVEVHPGPLASVVELAVTQSPPAAFIDSAYSRALDRLWLLDRAGARVFSWDAPAGASSANLQLQHSLDFGFVDALSLDDDAAPGAVIISQRTKIVRLDDSGDIELLWQATGPGPLNSFDDVGSNPTADEWFVAFSSADFFGEIPSTGVTINFNLWPGLCSFRPVDGPEDMRWDPISNRMIVIAANGLNCFSGGSLANRPNHVVRFPKYQVPGNPAFTPVLLTPEPDSGITGSDPDLAHVRLNKPAVTLTGVGSPASDGTQPLLHAVGKVKVGGAVTQYLTAAPGAATAFLVLGTASEPQIVAGNTLYPKNPIVLPFVTGADGTITQSFSLPMDPALAGVHIWTQWWIADPAGGFATTWAAVFSIGP